MDTLQPGQMLGPYRVISQIGKGGMATVYKAYQASVDRYVAIKVLPGQLAESREFAARFQQEARIIANLEHPHILPVFDYGESGGVAYLVMRYLDAGTLRDRMEAGRPLPLAEIDRIFTQLTDALSYAHSHGIVHRDLKPSNALIDQQGNIFLTDFGIAKLLESASPRLTQTDAILGTPAYISPEQAQSKPVDQRSDIYSLGIILYEMATGSVPFTADTPLAVLFKHITDPLPPPSSLKPDIHPAIERVILKALAKDPQHRFATAAEFLAAWKRALEEAETVHSPKMISTPVPPQPKPVPAPGAESKPGSSTGWVVGCLAGACLLFSVAGIAFLGLNWQNIPFLNPPTETPIPTQTASPTPPTEALIPTNTVIPTPATFLLRDDFSSQKWGTATDKDSSVKYTNKALQMIVYKKNWFVWSTPNEQDYQNVHIEVTAINNGTDPTTTFGIICNKQANKATFYYFAISPGGQYAIAKSTDGQDDVFLTNNNQWANSTGIKNNAASYRLSADCNSGRLVFYVDGQKIASVSDSAYTHGKVALFTWSGQNAKTTNMSFDDFLITPLR